LQPPFDNDEFLVLCGILVVVLVLALFLLASAR
jgi:hypothetical protein